MVEGSDKLLDYIAEGRKEVTLVFSEVELVDSDTLVLINKCMFNGAYYKADKYNGYALNMKVWLCNVTKFVMGGFPEIIYFKKLC